MTQEAMLDMTRQLECHFWDCTITSFIDFFFPTFEVDRYKRVQSKLPLQEVTEFCLTYQQQSHNSEADREKLDERLLGRQEAQAADTIPHYAPSSNKSG
jgi:hypothetical protein